MDILQDTLLGLFFGTFGTTIGGIIGVKFGNVSNKFLSLILSFASGLMLSIVCFDLIPEAMQLSDFNNVIIGVVFGSVVMVVCDIVIQNKINTKKNIKKNSLLKTGIACRYRSCTS